MSQPPTPDYRHKEHPKRCAPDDFWGQVSRTVKGQPVSDQQIRMIVSTIESKLALTSTDVLLDLGCGNGALSSHFFEKIAVYLGVDFSEYLIEVAKLNFRRANTQYQCQDAATYTRDEPSPHRFTKALCYGAFSYLSRADAREVLRNLSERFVSVTRVLIGNLPDRNRAHQFYDPGIDYQQLLDDRSAAIGIWRTRDEFRELSTETGWSIQFYRMPPPFYGAHYRYDVILHRPETT